MDVHVSTAGTITGHLSSPATISGEIVMPTYFDVDLYDGPTEIVPSDDAQVLQTLNKTVVRNIVINPIPENYGRLLYSGKTLTVY